MWHRRHVKSSRDYITPFSINVWKMLQHTFVHSQECLITVRHLIKIDNGKLPLIWLAKKDNLMLLDQLNPLKYQYECKTCEWNDSLESLGT